MKTRYSDAAKAFEYWVLYLNSTYPISDRTIRYFDGSETRESYYSIPPEEFYFSPDGKILAILKEDEITISRVNYSD